MSHPTLWPKKVFFYPIGNTPPTCLTDHLPPEEDAKILLLGCGDSRNILYTIAVDHGSLNRKMDITCCDLEPAIIARNVLLFTFIIDSIEPDKLSMYWNIFYDLFLDNPSSSLLRQQCAKLTMLASDLDSWSSSCYGTSITFVTEESLMEARNHWQFYKNTLDLPENEQRELKENFHSAMKESVICSHATSPTLYAFVPATFTYPETIQTGSAYWKNGITGSKDSSRPLINPTFLFSLAGRKFNLHFGTDPCSSFHMMLAFIRTSEKSPNTIPAKTEHDMWAACRAQFSGWCLTTHKKFHNSPHSLTVRFVVADALSFCQGLRPYQNGILETTIYDAPWGGRKLHFYDNSTPKFFNVIDTSNLSDHLGLLNVLITAQPLMEYSASAVLHTIALLPYSVHPTERSGVKERALLDFPSISLLLGITPICFFSGFTFRNNAEGSARVGSDGKIADRNYERMLWKISNFICTNEVPNGIYHSQRIVIDPKELADKLLSLYLKMFAEEDPFTFFLNTKNNPNHYLKEPHYNRESFVRFVSALKSKTSLETDWSLVGKCFVELVIGNKQLIVGASNYQALFAQLHIHGVYSVPSFRSASTSTGVFKGWNIVPSVVFVVFMIPRTALMILDDVDYAAAFECETYIPNGFHHTHSSIRPIFGKLLLLQNGMGTIQEDPQGLNGDSPLLISFPILSGILVQDPNIRVGLALKYTTRNHVAFFKKLGSNIRIFSKALTDHEYVSVLRERPDNNGELEEIGQMSIVNPPRMASDIDTARLSFKDGVGWICKRLSITDEAKKNLENKAAVSSKQDTPCCIWVSFSNLHYSMRFPVPVDHTRSKIRIARKSGYIEIEAPLRMSPLAQVDLQPFPLISMGPNAVVPFICWNVPYVNLDRLFSTHSKDLKWAPFHLASAFSKEERDRYPRPGLSNVKEETAYVAFKSTIRAIFTIFHEGKGTPRIFPLFATNTSRIFALIFLHRVRIDLSSGTSIGDAVVIIPTPSNALLLQQVLTPEIKMINCYGEVSHWWRCALPVFAERCRTWKHRTSACEYRCASDSVLVPAVLSKNLLCSCGQGKDLGPFMTKWKGLARYATRVAISTIFPVTYLEDTSLDVREAFQRTPVQIEVCSKCGGIGNPKLLHCSGCRAKYCSKECQKVDWKTHKIICKSLKK